MSVLVTWVHTPAAAALGWTLAHSLWEGAAVALALAVALAALRGSRARYGAACLTMLALLVGLSITYRYEAAQQRMPGGNGYVRLRAAPVDAGDGAITNARGRLRAAAYLPWLAPFWMAGVVVFQLRSVVSWRAARRLGRRGVCAAPELWQRRMESLAARLRVSRPVTLLESCIAEVPVVMGHVRPVILMPVGLLTGLPAAQIEAILLHELAHIARRDYLVNLMQIVVEGLVFYHPAVWWISGVMRSERENCCDDLVVATQGDALGYAAALAALEENRGTVREAALAATGGSLMKRVRRLLAQPEGPRASLTPLILAAILTVSLAAVLAAWQSPAPPPRPATPDKKWLRANVANIIADAEAAAWQSSAPLPLPVKPYAKWLHEDVSYIITDAERAAFKRLQDDAERDHFIEQFWLRRDPTPNTVENEFKEEHYRRIAFSNENYSDGKVPGWKTDRGRIYITYGPPDEKEVHSMPVPSEYWRYRFIAGIGTDIFVEFVDADRDGLYRMTTDPSVR